MERSAVSAVSTTVEAWGFSPTKQPPHEGPLGLGTPHLHRPLSGAQAATGADFAEAAVPWAPTGDVLEEDLAAEMVEAG